MNSLVNRRRFILGCLGSALLVANPKYRPNGNLQIVNSADAWVLAALSIAVSAAGLFMKSDGGMGAMLGSLKELSEENIRLSQAIVKSVAEVQATLDTLPERLRAVLIENDQYKVRHTTASITSNLAFVQFFMKEDPQALKRDEVREKLKQCIEWGSELAGAQEVPYGIGPVGALCAPIVAASVAKAHTLLGQRQFVRAEMATKYLPWLVRVKDPQSPNSLMGLLLQEGKRLEQLESTVEDRIPPRIKERLGATVRALSKLEAGSSLTTEPFACLSYMQQVGERKDECKLLNCKEKGPYSKTISESQASKISKYLSQSEFDRKKKLAQKSLQRDLKPSSSALSGIPPFCFCVEWKMAPVYAEGTIVAMRFTLQNTTTAEKGPSLADQTTSSQLFSNQPRPGFSCDPAIYGADLGDESELRGIIESSTAESWMNEIRALTSKGLHPLVEQREIIWAYFNLLQSAKEAEERMRGVFEL